MHELSVEHPSIHTHTSRGVFVRYAHVLASELTRFAHRRHVLTRPDCPPQDSERASTPTNLGNIAVSIPRSTVLFLTLVLRRCVLIS